MNIQEQERDRAAEQWLDEAIVHMHTRDAGPRPGLEGRVLAGLRAHQEQWRRRWTLLLAGSAAAVLVVALVASWPRARTSTPEIVRQNPPEQKQVQVQVSPVPSVATVKSTQKKSLRVRAGGVDGIGERPALSPAVEARETTFPSPAPLNEQGRLLQAYLRQTPPQQLALMAAREPSLKSLESEDIKIAPLEIADLTPKAEATKDQDQH
jgi:hypothetical protein